MTADSVQLTLSAHRVSGAMNLPEARLSQASIVLEVSGNEPLPVQGNPKLYGRAYRILSMEIVEPIALRTR